MTAKEYLENEAKIWVEVDDDNITKSVIIQIAEGYAKHLIDKYNTDLCEFAEWLDAWGWKQSVRGLWIQRYFPTKQKTTSQLIEQWKLETGKISSINKKQGCALESKDICDYDEKCDDCPHFH